MRIFYTLLLLTFFVFIVSHAQTISGVIIDQETKEKLIGVNIITKDGKGTATDIFGKYILKLEAGNHQITYRYIGYKDVIKDITLKNGEKKKRKFFLEQINNLNLVKRLKPRLKKNGRTWFLLGYSLSRESSLAE